MATVKYVEVERETEKALLVSIAWVGAFAEIWVPKSLIQNRSQTHFDLPVWFLQKNGF